MRTTQHNIPPEFGGARFRQAMSDDPQKGLKGTKPVKEILILVPGLDGANW